MKYYLTTERLRELEAELERLKKEERAEIAERLRRAKEYGDLSENSEYIDAKDAQSKLEVQIFEMEDTIRNAVIIKKTKGKTRVDIGSTVEVQKNGKTIKFTIVGSEEANPETYLISNESPLGRAFLGKEPGAVIEVETPSRKTNYKIVKIE